ncbi:MAG: AmmeMemoRadiSam system protein B [Candidatus Cloacimonetes bacterium HGW-Cloacimonetes-1]|jgi:hypothetical protein|nr:MAG: AmmeMemoRadiSam system protein B [Candidatus Cloacimonetes bacterium HGW-Cloacimonetes-1]
MQRKAQFSGSFYQRFAEPLKRDMDKWFTEFPVCPQSSEQILGIIVPHAGYMYSGNCAAIGYHRMQSQNYDSLIILHPSHRGAHFDFNVSPFTEYETPFGIIKQDKEVYDQLLMRENHKIENWYNLNEHSMEIQLPFIQRCFPDVPVNAIMIGNQTPEVAQRLALHLNDIIAKSSKRIGIIVSTDLSHYRSAEKAEQLDTLLIKHVHDLAPELLWQDFQTEKTEACGIGGILCLMYLSKKYRQSRAKILDYTHSGRITGELDQVVGYLSAVITI